MRIRHIRIENYRSIKSLDISPSDMMVLVGPNNAGKTNILSALNFLLGDRWPMRQGLEEKDWFNKDLSQTVLIQVWFDSNPDNIHSVWFRCPGEESKAETRYSTRINGRTSSHYLSNDIRDKCALVYLDAGRNFDSQFSQSRWSLFGRIIRMLHDDFQSSIGVANSLEYHLRETQKILETPLYKSFETAIREAFRDQLKGTGHDIRLDFRLFDPLNLYRSLQPVLIENDEDKNPSEAGSGMRNLIVLSLFRAYAKAFKGNALIALEEPEIYLHPQAQRSLARLFDELAAEGSQIFFSTHSPSFVDISRSDRIALTDRLLDEENDICTQVRTLSSKELLTKRKELLPDLPMTEKSIRARYRNVCHTEHAEAFFSKAILLVEGSTEAEAFPIFARKHGVDFDSLNVSVVPAYGKRNLDMLYQLYEGHGIPVFMVFDNDRGMKDVDANTNNTLTRLLGLVEADIPDPILSSRFCILEGDFEQCMRTELGNIRPGLYEATKKECHDELGPKPGKPLIARFIATAITDKGVIPPTFKSIIESVQKMADPQQEEAYDDPSEWDIPF